MLNKNKFKNIIKQELLPLKLSLLEHKKILENNDNFEKDYELEHYYDTHFLMVTDIFYKLNSILLKIKFNILSEKGVPVGEIIELVFGKKNGNNIYSLFNFIEKEIKISFDPQFVYYCVIVETLVRHQFSHGFGKSLLYMSDGHQMGLLFHHYDRWFKYKDIEGNENSFGAIGMNYLNNSDYFHCKYFNQDFTVVLNSRSARTIMQFRWMKIKLNAGFDTSHLVKQRNKFIQRNPKSIDKISIHKYNEKWMEVNPKKLNQLVMFPNYACDHINDHVCFVCKKKLELDNSKSLSEEEKNSIINKLISKNNITRCKEIFISIIQSKLSNAQSNIITKFNENNSFNEYFNNILLDIFGKILDINYFEMLNDKKGEILIKEIEILFKKFTSDDIKQFICYKFKSDFIPTQIKIFAPFIPPFVSTNSKDDFFYVETSCDLSINYGIFLKSIKTNFLKFYNTLYN